MNDYHASCFYQHNMQCFPIYRILSANKICGSAKSNQGNQGYGVNQKKTSYLQSSLLDKKGSFKVDICCVLILASKETFFLNL